MSEYNSPKTKIYRTKIKTSIIKIIMIGKDDTIQVLQPYFHSGPYI